MAQPFSFLLDENDDLIIPIQFATGLDAVRQRLRINCRMIKGEWRYNEDAGIDYRGKIWGRGRSESDIRSEFRKAILETPGVISLDSLTVGEDRPNRTLTIEYKARVDVDGVVSPLVDSIEVG